MVSSLLEEDCPSYSHVEERVFDEESANLDAEATE
jgi:hypothetical protein